MRPGLAPYGQRCRRLCGFKAWQGAPLKVARRLWALTARKNVVLTSPPSDETGPSTGRRLSSVQP
jgi:hypothetical protein